MTAKAGESHHGKKKERKKGGQIVVQKDKRVCLINLIIFLHINSLPLKTLLCEYLILVFGV